MTYLLFGQLDVGLADDRGLFFGKVQTFGTGPAATRLDRRLDEPVLDRDNPSRTQDPIPRPHPSMVSLPTPPWIATTRAVHRTRPPGHTRVVNRTLSRRRCCGPPNQRDTAVARYPAGNIPIANTVGAPVLRAYPSSMWIGL